MRLLPEREVIGQADCPLMYRWTLFDVRVVKMLVHYFLPTQRDRDPHDHPRSFITFVFRGGYVDIQPCRVCHGRSWEEACSHHKVDEVRAPAIRYRRAEHSHITVAGEAGAWSIVLMGPIVRAWGFIRHGKWWPYKDYEAQFGGAFRCGGDET